MALEATSHLWYRKPIFVSEATDTFFTSHSTPLITGYSFLIFCSVHNMLLIVYIYFAHIY